MLQKGCTPRRHWYSLTVPCPSIALYLFQHCTCTSRKIAHAPVLLAKLANKRTFCWHCTWYIANKTAFCQQKLPTKQGFVDNECGAVGGRGGYGAGYEGVTGRGRYGVGGTGGGTGVQCGGTMWVCSCRQ